ncbi:hypothetical protein PG996_015539 [Apiospora saccharicola]|uniref:Uncharacterized protein n=1 Tax=Apiospora saccharicola TaxID=335842 RepID=A0ABR1TLE6_9PEZI
MAGHKRPGPDPGPHDWYRDRDNLKVPRLRNNEQNPPDPGKDIILLLLDRYRRGRGFPEDYDPTDDVWLYRNYPRDMTDLVKDCAPRNNALMRNLATGGPE